MTKGWCQGNQVYSIKSYHWSKPQKNMHTFSDTFDWWDKKKVASPRQRRVGVQTLQVSIDHLMCGTLFHIDSVQCSTYFVMYCSMYYTLYSALYTTLYNAQCTTQHTLYTVRIPLMLMTYFLSEFCTFAVDARNINIFNNLFPPMPYLPAGWKCYIHHTGS